MTDERQYAPATLRNRDFIRDVLPLTGVILEISSGSGEHIVHFVRNFRLSFSNLPILNRLWDRITPRPLLLLSGRLPERD
jgi:hypothetical protein